MIYSTQIQKFAKGGIVAVANHIKSLSSDIEMVIKRKEIDYELFYKLVNVDYSLIKKNIGNEQKLYSFASKFLSFTLTDVYPIMDRRVRTILGLSDSVSYESFCNEINNIKENYKRKYEIDMSFKQWDMFLWQWEKELEKGV